MRVRIFIDFWNLQLAWNAYHSAQGASEVVRIPWRNTLPDVITRHVHPEGVYAGTNVYTSWDPANSRDAGLRRFLNVLDGFPGYKVIVKERKPRGPQNCPHCHQPVTHCPHCSGEMKRTVEKGVDTALVTDLIQLGIDDMFDYAVLVSADADFVPAVEFIQNRTQRRVVHAHIRPQGAELRNACWDHVYLDDMMAELMPTTP